MRDHGQSECVGQMAPLELLALLALEQLLAARRSLAALLALEQRLAARRLRR